MSTTGLIIAGQHVDNSPDIFHGVEKYLTVSPENQTKAAFQSSDMTHIRGLENPVARQIVDAMKVSSVGHHFTDTFEISENIRLRQAAIEAFANCNTGAYDMDYFDPANNILPRLGSAGDARVSPDWQFMFPQETWDAEFSQIPDTTASKAVAAHLGATFPFRGECAGAFQMAVYYGLLNGLGADRLNDMAAKFGTMYIGPWRVGENSAPNPATLYMQKAPLSDPHIPGDYLYFKNKDDYLKWAPDGFWTGLNAMYMGKDALGVPHYSGMGASWLSEINLRAALVNAYYHDCSPHTIADPLTEVRFTLRAALVIPTHLEKTMPHSILSGKTDAPLPTTASLLAEGFTQEQPGLFTKTATTLGELAKDLGFQPDAVRQVASADFGNPPHKYSRDGMTVIIHYTNGIDSRQDPAAPVSAIVHLKGAE